MDEILIEEPVWIRFYHSGGKGGFGYGTSPWHRLVARSAKGDRTACGSVSGDAKYVVRDRKPTTHTMCPKCWG